MIRALGWVVLLYLGAHVVWFLAFLFLEVLS